MFLIALLIYCVVGSFSAGMVSSLHNETAEDPFALVMMTIFAPVTFLYLVGLLSMKLGMRLVNAFKG